MLGVWRKVPESDARSLEEGAGKRCSEFGGRCRKAMLGVCLFHYDTLHVADAAVVCLVEVLTVTRVPVFLLMFERCSRIWF